jgi:conjugative transfer signal peptidase TraF
VPVSLSPRLAPRSRELRAGLARLAGIVTLGTILAVVAARVGHRMVWNLSASVPRGLYLVKTGAECRRGSLVSFPPPPGVAPTVYSRGYLPSGAGLLKRVVGLPGDRVCISGAGYYANGVRLGDVARSDSRGRPLAPFLFCDAVPPGYAFVATAARLSFDSRYFGPLPVSSLTIVEPLWTY